MAGAHFFISPFVAFPFATYLLGVFLLSFAGLIGAFVLYIVILTILVQFPLFDVLIYLFCDYVLNPSATFALSGQFSSVSCILIISPFPLIFAPPHMPHLSSSPSFLCSLAPPGASAGRTRSTLIFSSYSGVSCSAENSDYLCGYEFFSVSLLCVKPLG